jgi:hypothetical protein
MRGKREIRTPSTFFTRSHRLAGGTMTVFIVHFPREEGGGLAPQTRSSRVPYAFETSPVLDGFTFRFRILAITAGIDCPEQPLGGERRDRNAGSSRRPRAFQTRRGSTPRSLSGCRWDARFMTPRVCRRPATVTAVVGGKLRTRAPTGLSTGPTRFKRGPALCELAFQIFVSRFIARSLASCASGTTAVAMKLDERKDSGFREPVAGRQAHRTVSVAELT